jgi:hypothetical protein
MYDTPQDQSLMIKQLVKENQNLKLKARCSTRRVVRGRAVASGVALRGGGASLRALRLAQRMGACYAAPARRAFGPAPLRRSSATHGKNPGPDAFAHAYSPALFTAVLHGGAVPAQSRQLGRGAERAGEHAG